MVTRLLLRPVKLFGRSIPLAAVAAAVMVIGAAAWLSIFFMSARFNVQTSEGMETPVSIAAWSCTKISGTDATITNCGYEGGGSGPYVAVSGLSEDDLLIEAKGRFSNPNAQPMTLTLVGAQNPLVPVCLSAGSGCVGSLTIPAGAANFEVQIDIRTAGIGAGMSVDITGLQLQWAP